jgi:hypothetical protein
MTRDFLETLTRRYHAYVDTFRAADGALPQMLQLKLEHTLCVVGDAKRIMAGEAWPEGAYVLGEACALLHDVGRYSQLQEFETFQDAKSIDHAARGVEVTEREGLLEGLDGSERKRIRTTVALHNKKSVPAALDAETARLVHLVRDADKLDIFRVMEVAIEDGSLERNPEIAWELQLKGPPTTEVVEAVRQGHSVSYALVKSLSDFVLIQVGWLIGGLHYPAALRLASERRVLEYREAFLKTLSDDPGAGVCCAAARAYLNERLNLPVIK